MNICIGDMWSAWNKTNHFIFTGNSFIKNNGALVMGRGIAKVVRDQWVGVDQELGKAVKERADLNGFYGLILGKKLGVFQVKYHFKDNAELDLIKRSAVMLKEHAEAHPDERYDMNMPGIGWGHLAYDSVLPLLQDLPSNVHVWQFK